MFDEETFNAIRALHTAFVERGDFSPPGESSSAEIETSWPNFVRSDVVLLGVALVIGYSSLHQSIAWVRRKYAAPPEPTKLHPRRRLSNDEGI